MSHLLQMRGLKLLSKVLRLLLAVASFTDAWIETAYIRARKDEILSHLLQMRGLKQGAAYAKTLAETSHLLQMRGLKQTPVP